MSSEISHMLTLHFGLTIIHIEDSTRLRELEDIVQNLLGDDKLLICIEYCENFLSGPEATLKDLDVKNGSRIKCVVGI